MSSLADRVTRCLRELFECEVTSFDLIDLSNVRWNALVVTPAVADWDNFLATLQQFAHEHPIVSHAARHQYRHAIRISDLTSLRQYRQLGIYREIFQSYVDGADRQLGFVVKPSATLAFGASVNRRGKDFTVEQRTLMELLRPHLERAYVHGQLVADLRRQAGLEASLTTTPKAEKIWVQAHGLTRRETEVLRWLAVGKRDNEIARILGVSPYTVHSHVAKILAKLQVETRTAAAAVAHQLFAL